MDSYLKHKLMPGLCQKKTIKKGVIPHIFNNQEFMEPEFVACEIDEGLCHF